MLVIILGLKEGLVECATVFVKSDVILSGLCEKKVLLSGKEMAFPDTYYNTVVLNTLNKSLDPPCMEGFEILFPRHNSYTLRTSATHLSSYTRDRNVCPG